MTGVVAYEDALRAAGIPFRTVGGRHYYDRSEVGWTIAALGGDRGSARPRRARGRAPLPVLRRHGRDAPAASTRPAASSAISGRSRPAPTRRWPRAWTLLGALHRERNAVAPAAVVERLLAGTRGPRRLRARAPGRGARRQPPEGPRHRAGARGDGGAHVPRARPVAPRSRGGPLRGGGVGGRRRGRGAAHDDPQGQGSRVPRGRRARPRARGAVAGAGGPGGPRIGAARREPGPPGRHGADHARLGGRRGPRDPAGGRRGAARPLRGPHARGARPRPARAARGRKGKGFYQYLAALLGAPTDVLTRRRARAPGRAVPRTPTALARGRRRRSRRGARATERSSRAGGGGRARARRAATARAAGRLAPRRPSARWRRPPWPARRSSRWTSAAPTTALRGRHGARVAPRRAAGGGRRGDAAPRAGAGGPGDRARAPRLVAARATCRSRSRSDGAVAEDRLDLVFEEPGGLVVVRVDAGAGDAASPGLPPDALAPALGRPVREALVLSLSGG